MFISSGYSAHTRSTRVEALAPPTAAAAAGASAAVAGPSAPAGPSTPVACSGTKHHHDAADVLLGRCDLPSAIGTEPRRDPLALELECAHVVELDHVSLGRVLARRGAGARGGSTSGLASDPALPFDHDALPLLGHARRATDVQHSIDAHR